jgi:hypothetical protein
MELQGTIKTASDTLYKYAFTLSMILLVTVSFLYWGWVFDSDLFDELYGGANADSGATEGWEYVGPAIGGQRIHPVASVTADGWVISPFTGRLLDVGATPSGTILEDPSSGGYFLYDASVKATRGQESVDSVPAFRYTHVGPDGRENADSGVPPAILITRFYWGGMIVLGLIATSSGWCWFWRHQRHLDVLVKYQALEQRAKVVEEA